MRVLSCIKQHMHHTSMHNLSSPNWNWFLQDVHVPSKQSLQKERVLCIYVDDYRILSTTADLFNPHLH